MRLRSISGREMIKLLSKLGFISARQTGSHVSLYKKTGNETLIAVVPMKKEIKIGTLLSILRQARMSREEFEKLRDL